MAGEEGRGDRETRVRRFMRQTFPLPECLQVSSLESVTFLQSWTECPSSVGLIILSRKLAIASTTDSGKREERALTSIFTLGTVSSNLKYPCQEPTLQSELLSTTSNLFIYICT